MDSDSIPFKSLRSWLLTVGLLLVFIGMLFAFAIPNFVGGGPSRLSSIINNLRQIDGAKHQWALEHGISNASQVVRELTDQDIAPYLRHKDNEDHFDRFGSGFDRNGYVHPVVGEKYTINSLGVSPEVKFSKKFDLAPIPMPKGGIIKLDENGSEEYVLPDQPSKAYRWIGGTLTITKN